jgi:hypothetical protein
MRFHANFNGILQFLILRNLYPIYRIELELNDTSDTLRSTSYLDLQFEICFV